MAPRWHDTGDMARSRVKEAGSSCSRLAHRIISDVWADYRHSSRARCVSTDAVDVALVKERPLLVESGAEILMIGAWRPLSPVHHHHRSSIRRTG